MGRGRLVLVRHGESVAIAQGIYGCHRACRGLTPTGVAQAERLRDRVAASKELDNVTAVYASLLPRAIQTAEIVTSALVSPPIVTRCGLCELHASEADGLTRQERLGRFGGPESLPAEPDVPIAPGGETWNGFIERAAGALRDLVDEHGDETIMVFTHSGVIGASFVAFGGLNATSLFTTPPAATSMTEWRWRDGSLPRLFTYGDAGHLPVNLRYIGTYA